MKKIFLFLTFMGITLGLILGVRSAFKNIKKDDEIQNENSGDSYIHELNIPIMEIDSLNPLLTKNVHVSNILNLIYEPLVSISKEESITPALAIEWAQKDDLNWIVKLRKDVKWHNGSDFTSKDVIFTVNVLRDENINSVYRSNMINVASIEEIDAYSVNFTLLEKDDFFIYKLLFPIIPEYYFKNGDVFNESKSNIPIGTGAYKYVTTNLIEDYIQLEKNSDWWNNSIETKLTTIYLIKYATYGEAIKAYKSAKVDLIITSMSDWAKKFGTIGNNVYRFESSTFDTLIPNTKKINLSDSSVRKAILFAINRENIVSKIFESNATVCDIPFHTRSKNYLSGLQSEYDIDRAKQVLTNAGWANDGKSWQKNGQKLKFSLLVNEGNIEQVRAAEIIKENLADINIDITIKKLSWDKFQKALYGDDFDMAFTSIDIKNELSILELVKSNGTFNYANYSNIKMDEAVQNVANEYTENTMQTLERIYKDETPYIGLYFRDNTLLTNKSVKGSIEPVWSNPFANISTWCK